MRLHSPAFAFLVTTLVAFTAFFVTLPPSITLDWAGQFVVAADFLGVPIPPGYPLWTILAWFFQWVFHGVTFQGQPNPAWPVALMSAVFGALACGIVAVLSRCIVVDELSRSRVDVKDISLFATVSSISAGLLLAFSPAFWSVAVVANVHSLHVFFVALILYRLYVFDQAPDVPRNCWINFLLLGLGAANSQAIVEMLPVILLVMALRRPRLTWSMVAPVILCIEIYYLNRGMLGSIQIACLAMVLVLLAFLPLRPYGLTAGRSFLCLLIGPLLYGFLPIASDQNPPMNWAYARVPEGFWHALSRGQFERISIMDNFQAMLSYPTYSASGLVNQLFSPQAITSLPFQYSLVIACVALVPLVASRGRWPRLLIVVALMLSFLIWLTAMPRADLQTQLIYRNQFIPVHVAFTPVLAAGLAMLLASLAGSRPAANKAP